MNARDIHRREASFGLLVARDASLGGDTRGVNKKPMAMTYTSNTSRLF